jgi:hypothetical protein
MTVRTPTKQKKKSGIPSCGTVDLEFTQRFLLLFTSFYDAPTGEEITVFPPAPPDTSGEARPSPAKIPPFQSGVWDLRLKKVADARVTADKVSSEAVSEQVLQLRDSLAAEAPDLNDIFVPRKAQRPDVPLYIKNWRQDQEDLKHSFKPRGHAQGENVAELSQLFTERLERQKAIAKERARRRFRIARQLEREHKEFVSHLFRSKTPVEPVKIAIENEAREMNAKRTKRKELQQEDRQAVQSARSQNQSPRRHLRSEDVI